MMGDTCSLTTCCFTSESNEHDADVLKLIPCALCSSSYHIGCFPASKKAIQDNASSANIDTDELLCVTCIAQTAELETSHQQSTTTVYNITPGSSNKVVPDLGVVCVDAGGDVDSSGRLCSFFIASSLKPDIPLMQFSSTPERDPEFDIEAVFHPSSSNKDVELLQTKLGQVLYISALVIANTRDNIKLGIDAPIHPGLVVCILLLT